jgi:hypothetical protein
VARGGLGARKKLAERQAKAVKYRLTGVEAGSAVVECLDRYRRWSLGHRVGYIARNGVEMVHVQWEDADDLTVYPSSEARYYVDTNRWRITPPRAQNVMEALSQPSQNGASCALTGKSGHGSIMLSPPTEGTETREIGMAAAQQAESSKITAKFKKPASLAPVADKPVDRETYTAKQVATRISTDAKTLRKFFRSDASTVEPVGQGGRYEFDAADLPQIKAEFSKWNSRQAGKSSPTGKSSPKPAAVVEVDEDAEELDDASEPSEEELALEEAAADELGLLDLDEDDEEDE